MTMVDLKMTKKDMAEEADPSYEQSPYPSGACLNLDTDELAKLGITGKNLPEVGDEFRITAIGKVTRVSENETETSDYSCGLGIQITMMDLQPEDEAPEANDSVEEERADSAERKTVGARSTMTSAYRGRA